MKKQTRVEDAEDLLSKLIRERNKYSKRAILAKRLIQNYRMTWQTNKDSPRELTPSELEHVAAISKYHKTEDRESRIPVSIGGGRYKYTLSSFSFEEDLIYKFITRKLTYETFMQYVVPALICNKKLSSDYREHGRIFHDHDFQFSSDPCPKIPTLAAPKHISPEVNSPEELQVYFLNMERKNPSLSLIGRGDLK
jgi:hypothetical protein